jgi:hypothetical protein
LMFIRRQGLAADAAAKRYGVSLDMLQYRLNVTGVDTHLARTRRWTRRPGGR